MSETGPDPWIVHCTSGDSSENTLATPPSHSSKASRTIISFCVVVEASGEAGSAPAEPVATGIPDDSKSTVAAPKRQEFDFIMFIGLILLVDLTYGYMLKVCDGTRAALNRLVSRAEQ
ncbi:hypothetical protein GCM10011322_44480 [Salinarimonas ramus]|uniref:Uncharacterized protein n=1 Tax=Salinarimonas ramus TaxID=690164 RepID=A0A917V9U5_9HYPH|nr:hypothetical protein GCM10011322_44480 [Salinarimonas ramus]